MLCYKKDKYTFPFPKWSVIKFKSKSPKKVYSIFDKDVLVCYASVNTFFYDYTEEENILFIDCLETNPKYRRKGYAKKILTMIFDDYPDNHFALNPTDDPNVHDLYAKMGFYLLYYDGGYDVYTLLKLAKNSKHSFDEISSAVSESDELEPCFFFYRSGKKWDNDLKIYPGNESDDESDDE